VSHLLICGAAGYTNVGDDAILWGMLTQLRSVLDSRPIKGDARLAVAGGPRLQALVEPFDAIAVSYDDRAELARAIEEADLVILGGGGLLYDVGYDAGLHRFLTDPVDRQWLYEMARLAAAASAAGRPVMLYSIGVGPLVTDAARGVARFICEQAEAITVRDQASADLLHECGVARSRVHTAVDPAILVEPGNLTPIPLSARGEGAMMEQAPRPWVAINLRPWGDEAGRERLVAEGVSLARAIREQLAGTPVLLPLQHMHDDDLSILQRIADVTGAVIMREALSPPQVVGTLAQFDLVIGMRLHALVLALAAGKPFVAISYDPKVDEFARRADMEKHLHAAGEFTADAVIASCKDLLSRDESADLRARRVELREAAALPAEMASELMGQAEACGTRRHRQVFGTSTARWARPVTPEQRPAGEIRVLMRIRPDFRERPGGDTVQMEQTKRALEKLGVRIAISGEDATDLSQCDLVHAFNLGRPEEPHRHCLEAIEQGKPVALSTVYWDFSEFWEWGDPDYWDLPPPLDSARQAKACGTRREEVSQAEACSTRRGLPSPRPAPAPDPIEARRRARLDQQRRAAIECATVYLPNGQGEAELLHDAYGMDLTRTVVVTNAVDEIFFSARPEPFVERHGLRDFVLCAARVEKRKNQLALVAALRGTGIPLVIIGQPNPEEYRELCRKYADANVTFLDALPQEELASAYAAAKVHALPGWFETPGLSTLEAAAAGCNIVTTDRGTAREYLGDGAWYCDPRDIDSIRAAVVGAYQAPASGKLRDLVRERYTWARAAESTLEGYRLALALHRRSDDRGRCEEQLSALRAQAGFLAKLAADRGYEAQQMRQWAEAVDAELRRLQAEFGRVASRRLHRWSSAVARAGWSVLRAIGVKG
jgi:polysaccharide pyruvyl transferase CsaB